MVPSERIEEERDEEIPYTYAITSYGADYPVESLVRKLQKKEIVIPQFQRGYVWTYYQACRFIESLLLGLPVPGIFLSKEEETQKLLVIDGQQRLRTLQFFYEGLFKGDEFILEDIQPQFEGKSYRTLAAEDRLKLDDSIVHATIVRQDVPSEDESSIYHIFERLNTGGTQLQPQEIRACIYAGEFNELLKKLNRNKHWRDIYGKVSPRQKDHELILRFFALLLFFRHYSRPMKGFLNKYMAKNKHLQLHSEDKLTRIFSSTIELVDKALGVKAFKPIRGLNAAVFDSVMVAIARRLEVGRINDLTALTKQYKRLLTDDAFIKAYKTATSDEETIKTRLKLAYEAFSDIK